MALHGSLLEVLVHPGFYGEDYAKDPWFDNRRSPAEHCLRERYNENITFEGEAAPKSVFLLGSRCIFASLCMNACLAKVKRNRNSRWSGVFF